MAKTAAELRKDAIDERERLRGLRVGTTGTQRQSLLDQMLAQGILAREQGDILRKASDREKGEGTRYVGPTGGTGKLGSQAAKDAREDRDLEGPTKWQLVNARLIRDEPGDTHQERMDSWIAKWGEPGSDEYKNMQAIQLAQFKKDYPDEVVEKPKVITDINDWFYSDNSDYVWDGSKWSLKSSWGGGDETGDAGEASLLAYRPGSNAYWKRYLGENLRGSLMKMKQPDVYQASLGYLPGEIRSPASRKQWAQFLVMGGLGTKGRSPDKQFQGAVPMGTWRTNPASYVGLGPGIVESGPHPGERRPGWQFAAQPAQMVGMPKWTPYDISPTDAGSWTGLLGEWAAPKLNTTNLLGAA